MGWGLSPDGRRLAIGIHTGEGDDIWVKELDDGPLVRLTQDPAEDARPAWTADGQSVYFSSGRGTQVSMQRADGVGSPVPIVRSSRLIWQAERSPDGAWLLVRVGGNADQIGGRDVLGYRLGGDTTEVPLLASPYDEVSPQISPDGRFLAYASLETGQLEVYVRPFPEVDSGRWLVSSGGGFSPRWAHSGRQLFYVSPDSVMMAAAVQTAGGFRVVERRALFAMPDGVRLSPFDFSFDVAPDDQRFIMQRLVSSGEAAAPPPMVLIENWAEEVKERVRAQRR
jgi:Tol biopolymer transport system component